MRQIVRGQYQEKGPGPGVCYLFDLRFSKV